MMGATMRGVSVGVGVGGGGMSRCCVLLLRHLPSVSTHRPPPKLARSSSSSRSKSNKVPFEPPPVPLDPSNSPLHSKAAQARALHDELSALLDAQSARRAAEASRPFGYGFLQFLKRSKSEIINIGAAFACVLLAYQVAGMRRSGRKLVDAAEEKEELVGRLRRRLAAVRGEDLAADLARKCARAAEDAGASDIASWPSKGGGRWFGWAFSSPSTSSNGDLDASEDAIEDTAGESEDELASLLRPIILREIRSVVGDTYLSDDEREEEKLRELTGAMGSMQPKVEEEVKGKGDALSMGPWAGRVSGGVTKAAEEGAGGVEEKGRNRVEMRGERERGAVRPLEEVLAEMTESESNGGAALAAKAGEGGRTRKRIRYAI